VSTSSAGLHTSEPLLIDAAAAGELLGLPESWIRRAAREGRIPHVKLGRYRRFNPAALEAWSRAQSAPVRTDPSAKLGLGPTRTVDRVSAMSEPDAAKRQALLRKSGVE
jgi:excisionase family DNA binding protein